MGSDFKARKATQQPPRPPRFEGEWAKDMQAMRDWLQEFYLFMTATSGLADPIYQQTIGQIDFDHLPDPTETTLARAQYTANKSWEDTEQLKVDLGADLKRYVFGGRVTISDGATEGNPVFDFDLGTTDYVAVAVASSSTGGPTVDSFRVIGITRGTGGIAIQITAAPGGGKSVTFDWIVVGKAPDLDGSTET